MVGGTKSVRLGGVASLVKGLRVHPGGADSLCDGPGARRGVGEGDGSRRGWRGGQEFL